MSHYDTLGVGKDASEADIKRAYRKKAKEAHPDRDGGDHSAMVALNRAYDTLKDKEKRARYDETGQDEGAREPTLDEKAAQMLAQAFDQLIGNEQDPPAHIDPLQLIKKALEDAIRAATFELKKVESHIAKLERRSKRVKRKERAGVNLWQAIIDDRRQRYAQIRLRQQEIIKVANRALELMTEEYEGTLEPGLSGQVTLGPPPSNPYTDTSQSRYFWRTT